MAVVVVVVVVFTGAFGIRPGRPGCRRRRQRRWDPVELSNGLAHRIFLSQHRTVSPTPAPTIVEEAVTKATYCVVKQ